MDEELKKYLDGLTKKKLKQSDVRLISMAQQHSNLNWHAQTAEANKSKAQTDKWKLNHGTAMSKLANDPDWLEKNFNTHAKPILTDQGPFNSRKAAIQYYLDNKILPTVKTVRSIETYIRNQILKKHPNFRYITLEEYIMLTGKE